MPKVFISHSWEDQDISRKLAENLQRDGAEVWIDYSRIEGGDSLPKVIGKAIEWCDTLILVWSKSAVDSFFVALEWECALTNQKRIIPCVLDDARLPILLTNKLFIAFRDFNLGYRALARALKLQIREKTPKSVVKKPDEISQMNTEVESKISERKKTEQDPPETADKILENKATASANKIEKKPFRVERRPKASRKISALTLNQKRWARRVVAFLVFGVLLVGGIKIVPEIVPRADQEYSTETAILESEENQEGLSVDEVKKMLKDNNFFDSSWNINATGVDNDFELQQDGQVVFDQATSLMWQQAGSSGAMTYEKAKEHIDQLNSERFAGFTDWRLPTLEEAMSLMESKRMNGDLYIDPIFDKNQSWIWTADRVKGESRAWVVDFFNGDCNYYRFYYGSSVRAVRSGQSSGGH